MKNIKFLDTKKQNLRFYSSNIACFDQETNLFRVKSLIIKFFKYQKRSPRAVL